MKFKEFIEDVKRKNGIDTDRYYGKQCMDLYNYFCNNVLSLHNCGANYAKNILNNKNIMDNVERINNYPEFIPQKRRYSCVDRRRLWTCCNMFRRGRFKSI